MISTKLLIIVIAIALVLSSLAFVFVMQSEKNKKNKISRKIKIGSPEFKNQLKVTANREAQKWYDRLSRWSFSKGLLRRVRFRIETLAVYDEYSLRREVMKIIFSIFSIFVVIALAMLIFRPSFVVAFWFMLALLFISGFLIDIFVHGVESRLLKQMKEFNNRIRYYYQQTKMVDEAIFDAMQFAGNEMQIQAEMIYKILTSANPEAELKMYEEVAPSRFLKVIAGLAVVVKDKGDSVDKERGSNFLHGLSNVNEELNAELLYRSKLSHKLRGLNILALSPLFFVLPIKAWSVKNFPITETFYDSRIGFFTEIALYSLSVAIYMLIRKMREINEAKYQSTVKRVKWEAWLIEKVPPIRFIVNLATPGTFTKEHFKLKELLKSANSSLLIEWFTLRRIILTISAFLIISGGLLYSHEREKNAVLYKVAPASLFTSNVTDEEYLVFKEQTDNDRAIIETLRNMDYVTADDIKHYITQQTGITEADAAFAQTYERVSKKYLTVINSYVKWYEIIIAMAIAWLIWFIPKLTLMFQQYLRHKDMENEVHQYLVLIGILKEFEHTSVYTILEWLERFGVVFKDPIQRAIQVYDAGPEEALDQLTDDVNFEPFQQIVERLKLAVVRISIKETFNDIDMERNYYMEQRKESNQRSIEEKSTIANILGFIPTGALFILYLVTPLIYVSLSETQGLTGML